MTGDTTAPVPIAGLPLAESPVRPVPYKEMPADLANRLAPRVRRLGYLGAFFALTAHQPIALGAFHDFTEALKAALPIALTETVALAASHRLGSTYEAVQHRRLAASLGFPAEWISAAATGHPEHTLAADERVVRRLAIDVLAGHGHGALPALQATVDLVGAEQAVAVLLLTGRYAAHGVIANTFGLTAPVAAAE